MSVSIIPIVHTFPVMINKYLSMSSPLTILIYEHLTSGGCFDVPVDSSLMVEGRAMAESLMADFQSLSNVSVVTMRDDRLPELEIEDVEVHRVASQGEQESIFINLCQKADRIIIIAPESAGAFTDRLETARKLKPFAIMNCFDRSLDIGCDKWELAKFCQQYEIPHISTALWMGQDIDVSYPMVIKPRDGAGCEKIVVVKEEAIPGEIKTDGSLIAQPMLEGISLSSAACFSSGGELLLTLPLGSQHVNIGDSVKYQGGAIPWRHEMSDEANCQAIEIWSILEQKLIGLWGYVGIDWLWQEETKMLRLVEINPRLTTAFVGYRQLFGNEIIKAMLEMPFEIDMANLSQISFTAGGLVNHSESMVRRP